MERLFFLITRWLMLIGATIAFIFLIGGGIYAFRLYKVSQDREVDKALYHQKEPSVSFDKFKKLHQEKLKLKEEERSKVEHYVLKVIENGSSGHGFSMGNMPSNMIRGDESKKVAYYISNKLEGEKPKGFASCAACHGEDGQGENGISPNLLKLPIYHGLVSKIDEKSSSVSKKSKETTKTYIDPLKQYSAKLTESINRYAITVGQEGVTVDQVFEFLKDLKNKYDSSAFETLKVELQHGVEQLLHDVESLKKVKNDMNNTIVWRDFIVWFLKDFDTQIAEESKKYQQSLSQQKKEESQKLSNATEAEIKLMQLLTALGTALIIFILLTMILVLFKIEANTRKKNEKEESQTT
jgi:cytochrome c2